MHVSLVEPLKGGAAGEKAIDVSRLGDGFGSFGGERVQATFFAVCLDSRDCLGFDAAGALLDMGGQGGQVQVPWGPDCWTSCLKRGVHGRRCGWVGRPGGRIGVGGWTGWWMCIVDGRGNRRAGGGLSGGGGEK